MAPAAAAAPAGGGPQKPPAGAETGGPPSAGLSRQMQVHYVVRLLALKGEASATQIRQRMKDGRGVTVKGLHFDPSVLAEALEKWSAPGSKEANIPAEASKPAKASPPSPAKSPVRPAVGKQLRSGEAAPCQPAGRRSWPPDENVDPQAMSAISRAAKEKAERRGLKRTSSASLEAPASDQVPRAATRQGTSATAAPSSGLGSAGPAASPPAAAPSPPAAPKPPLKRLRRGAPAAEPAQAPAEAARPAPAEPAPAEPAAAEPTPSTSSGVRKSIKELKLLLSECGLDYSGCVEKADLQALWDRFEHFRTRSLEELRASCAASGGPHSAGLEECARYLASPPKAAGESPGTKARATSATGAAPPPAEPPVDDSTAEAAIRERDAEKEVHRIQALKKGRFPTMVAWGFAVLDVTVRDVASVQRGYRSLMRKLHPDKVGRSAEVTQAVELIREAKELCERGLSKQEPPSAPRCLKSSTLCASHGRRKFKLQWLAPEERASAPVRRYIVAAVDPAYGRALTITVLEPDYSEELRRFVGVEDLTSYIFAEEELQKMPRLWQQPYASVQVAAANEAGQSPWAMLQLPLLVASALPQPDLASAWRAGPPAGPAGWGRAEAADDAEAFDRELRWRHGDELYAWLERQRKAQLSSWLKSAGWPSLGTKEELVERIAQAAGRKSMRRGFGKL